MFGAFGFRLLPWDYAIRNLFRRPARSATTLCGLTLVVLLILVVVGFIRGLEASLTVSGDSQVVMVHTLGAAENLEISSIPGRTTSLLSANLEAIQRQQGPGGSKIVCASPELYLGTQVNIPLTLPSPSGGRGQSEGQSPEATLGLVRGVTPAVRLVRRKVQIVEGTWPGPGELLVGRLAATKMGQRPEDLVVGKTLTFEGRTWKISGRFVAMGSTLESELWCPLDDLQLAMKRQDLSVVAVLLAQGAAFADLDEFCKERLDLELQATPETAYYEALQRHYGPIRLLAWLIVFIIAVAGVFTGMNIMYGAVTGRVRELATLQTIGFVRRAIAISLIQEGVVLAAAGSLIAAVIGVFVVQGAAVRFTMGAFTLNVDGTTLLIGFGAGISIGIAGSIPPAIRAMRLLIVEGLKAI
jgi:ABC-type antimicrobial peptide transport system permease subunit